MDIKKSKKIKDKQDENFKIQISWKLRLGYWEELKKNDNLEVNNTNLKIEKHE